VRTYAIRDPVGSRYWRRATRVRDERGRRVDELSDGEERSRDRMTGGGAALDSEEEARAAICGSERNEDRNFLVIPY
jgi:hypothetical protein